MSAGRQFDGRRNSGVFSGKRKERQILLIRAFCREYCRTHFRLRFLLRASGPVHNEERARTFCIEAVDAPL